MREARSSRTTVKLSANSWSVSFCSCAKAPKASGASLGAATYSTAVADHTKKANVINKTGGGNMMVPDSVSRRSASMMVPDSVSRRGKAAAAKRPSSAAAKATADSDESDNDEGGPPSFFILEDSSKSLPSVQIPPPVVAGPSTSTGLAVKANPRASNPQNRPLAFRGAGPHMPEEETPEEDLAHPMVGPSRPSHSAYSAYPEPEDLVSNEEAMSRLAGAHALKTGESMDVVDVDGKELVADTREWLTKALTEDETDKPGPRNTIKGEQKRKHQITYLAAQAKENEHKLKAQWATNWSNKKAAGAKYGFF